MAALLLTLEGAVRVRAWYRHGSADPVARIYQADERLGRRLAPGAALAGAERRLSINQWGFRGAEVTRAKPAGTIRLAALGDSTTFGMEASSDEAVWVQQAVAHLNRADDQRSYDAINAAVPGYTIAQSYHQLAEHIAPFAPDVVVVYQVGTNIAAHGRRQFGADVGQPARRSLRRLAEESSLLLNLIRLNTAAWRARYVAPPRPRRLDDEGVLQYAAAVQRLVEYCRAQGWPVLLCTCPRAFGDPTAPTNQYTLAASALANVPWLPLEGLNDAYDRYNDALRRLGGQPGVTLVDLDRAVPKRGDYFADALHLNDAGHAVVGEAVARAVREGALAAAVPMPTHLPLDGP